MDLSWRKTCRVCGCSSLTKVIDIGRQYLQGAFIKAGKCKPPMEKIPTSLVLCDPAQDKNGCGLLQMSCSVPAQILYSTYWYRSGTNQTMHDHLRQIAEEAVNIVNKDEAAVLDIGCNDGTLLNYYPASFAKFGIDPSDAVLGIKPGIKVIRDFFPSDELSRLSRTNKPFDIVTSIAMCYDLEDPIDFAKNIRNILSNDGIWVFEMAYMPLMLAGNSYDTICHEHLEYYSLNVLEYILNRSGLKMVKSYLNDINGGSIRCYAVHSDCRKFDHQEDLKMLQLLRSQERQLRLNTEKPYRDFQMRIDRHKEQLHTLLKEIKTEGKIIHAYGASTKGNTMLQFCGIDNSIIDYAAERNPDKFGARTLGTDIPIISEAESRLMNPDYYLVLPWHFKQEFIEREKEILRRGTRMIFPLPSIEIFESKENLINVKDE